MPLLRLGRLVSTRMLVLWSVLASVGIAAEPVAAQPSTALLTLTSEPLVFYPGERQVVPFVMTIPGTTALEVTRVEASCSCLVPGGIPSRLQPGKPITAAVMITAGQMPGEFNGTAWAWTRAGEAAERIIAMRVRGEVKDPIRWSADMAGPILDMGTCSLAETTRPRRFQLTHGEHPLSWSGIRVSSDDGGQLRAAIQPSGDGWELSISAASARHYGQVNGLLTFSLVTADGAALPYRPERTVRWRILGPITARPLSLLLGVVTSGATAEATTVLSSPAGVPVDVRRLTVSDPGRMTAKIAQVDGDQVLSVGFTATAPAGKASGHVDVEFADDTILRLPVLVTVATAAH